MKKKTLLLIEDDDLFRKSLLNFLSDQYEVLQELSAEDSLQRLQKQQPDVVLLDITLPGMDGRVLLKKIREAWPELPVIMLSAIDRIPTVVECIRQGAFDYLAKPVNPDELLMAIHRASETTDMRREVLQRRNLQLLSYRC
jgi:DNA-binding NtrC family response regulator